MEYFVAILACLILLGLAWFQTMLIMGKPYGDYAWGGYSKILPTKLRIASVSSVILYFIFSMVILQSIELISIFNQDYIKILTMYFGLGIFINLISKNKKERFVMVPVTLILFLSCLYLA